MSKKAKKKAARKPSTALQVRTDSPIDQTPMGIIARMARDPKLTVEKLERLIAVNERMMAVEARSAFNAAYDAMVMELPIITKRGIIKNKAGETQSRYAKFEDIMRVVKPILKRFGFTLKYRTEWPETLVAEVVGILTHSGGHFEESRFRSPADASGGKNAIQGLGSANAYGRRYTCIDLLNIVCEGVDTDGQASTGNSRRQTSPPVESRSAAPQTAPPAAQEPPHEVRHAAEGEAITQPQRKRLWAIMKGAGRGEEEMRGWLKRRYNLDSTAGILRKDYDAICKAVEAFGELAEK